MKRMDGNKHYNSVGARSNGDHDPVETVSTEQLQRLVRLLDRSDVSEIELNRPKDGLHLVLRKARSSTGSTIVESTATGPLVSGTDSATPAETRHTVVAPLVGIFHTWAKPKGGTLVALGDRVKVGQLVATIQSLNVINDVEAAVAGRVTEILVQDGQPVEYGQQLMIIDSTEGA